MLVETLAARAPVGVLTRSLSAGGHSDIVGQLAQQPFPKFASAPSGLFSPHGDDDCFELGRELVGVAVRGSRPVA